MQKWDYLVVEILGNVSIAPTSYLINGQVLNSQRPFFSFLKKLGEQGWELIAVNDKLHYFKRPSENRPSQ